MFGGSLPENVAVSDYAELIMAVKQAGARVVIDSDLFTLEDYHRISPWLIKPNIHELRRILPVEDDSDEAVLQAACTLQRAGVENVLVSRGADGILCVNSQTAVEAKSTVGAGDSALAGFLIGTVKEYGVEECVRLASACSSACVMQDGTALATRDLAFSLLDGITVERLPLPQEDTP